MKSRRSLAKELPFRNAVSFTLARIHLGIGSEVVGKMFGLTANNPKTLRSKVSFVFRRTLPIINKFFSKTVAQIPDLDQLDRDSHACFEDRDFANVMFILDASNIRHDRPSRPGPNKHTYSDYYGGNCSKFELVIGPDCLPLWVSYCFGARASEKSICVESNFEEFFAEFKKICVGGEGSAFPPDAMADKGTRMREIIEGLGAEYFCPSRGQEATYRDYLRNERIARARVHVERAIGSIKNCGILTNKMPWNLVYMTDDILYAAVWMSHFVL